MLAVGFGQAKQGRGDGEEAVKDYYVVLATPLRSVDGLQRLCHIVEDKELLHEGQQSTRCEARRRTLAYRMLPCLPVTSSPSTMTGAVLGAAPASTPGSAPAGEAVVVSDEEERDIEALNSSIRFRFDTYELPSFRRWLFSAACFTSESKASAVIMKRSNPRVGQDFIVILGIITKMVDEPAEPGGKTTMKTLRGRSFRVNRFGEKNALYRANSFARSPLFFRWISSESIPRLPEHPGPGFTHVRARNSQSAFVGQVNNEKIDCYCGQNEEDGFMHDCDKCGCWLHGHCTNLEEGHIPDNFACRACKLENPGMVIQLKSECKILELSSSFIDELNRDQREADRVQTNENNDDNASCQATDLEKADTLVCCICRCEDSEYDESQLVKACSCRPDSAMAHKSCLEGWSGHISARAFDGLADVSDQSGGTRSWTRKCRACASLGIASSEILRQESVLEEVKEILDVKSEFDPAPMEPRSDLSADQRSKKPPGFLSRVKVNPDLLEMIPPKKRKLQGL